MQQQNLFVYTMYTHMYIIIIKIIVVCLSVMGGQQKRFDLETREAVSMATEH